MRTKSKTLVCLLLGLVMLLSLAGLGIVALAEDEVVGKQATADASSFDSNGWYTQAAYSALADKSNVLSANGVAGYLGFVAPELIGGYTAMATHANGKIVNRNKLSVEEEISFEIGFEPGEGDRTNRFIHFVDSDSLGTTYLGVNERNTKFAISLNNAESYANKTDPMIKVEVYVNGEKQVLENGEDVYSVVPTSKTIWNGAKDTTFVSVKFGAETSTVSINNEVIAELDSIKTTDFASGNVQTVIDFWGGGGAPWVYFSAFNPFTAFKSSVASGSAVLVKQWDTDIVLDFTQPVTKVSVTNAKEEVVELVKDTDYTVSGNSVTLKATAITGKGTDYYPLNTQFVFTAADERTTTYNLQILYNDPPALVESQTSPLIVADALTEDLTVGVSYEREETYSVLLDGTALSAEDYTATWAQNTISLVLKQELVNGLGEGLHTFELKTMAGSIEYKVFRKYAKDEWVNADTMGEAAGGVASDGEAEGVVKGDNGSSTMHMGMLSRMYFSEPIDLSETLYLELDINKLEKGNGHGWFVIGLTSDIAQLSTFSEAATNNYLAFLYDHTKGEFQCPNFVSDLPTQTRPEYINQNGSQLFAFTITEEETIVTFNGQQIWKTDVWTLASFEGGKAYVGIFSGTGTLDITTRTNPASPAANTYGLEYTLGADTDVSFNIYNAAAVSAVKYGDEQLAADAYSFDAATGKLTIKGSYLQTIAYADMMNFTVVADGVELEVNIEALCEVSADKSVIATVGADGVVYENAFGGKAVTTVLDMDTLTELTASQFTFADGKLTIDAAYFTENKTYSFAVVTEDGLYFAMAIAEDYEDGWTKKDGAGTGTFADGKFSVKGEGNFLSEEFIDLTAGAVAFKVNITNVNGYFLNGLTGTSNAHVAVYLYDLYSGNTLTVEIHANNDPETAQAGAYLGYLVLTVRDKNGNNVYVNNTAIADSKNFHDGSVIGENTLVFRVENGSVVVELGGMPYYFNSVGNTVLTDLRLGVSSTADVEEEKMAFSVTETEVPSGDVHEPTDGGKDEPADNGWIIIVCVVAAVVVIGVVVAVVIVKKKKAGKPSDNGGNNE